MTNQTDSRCECKPDCQEAYPGKTARSRILPAHRPKRKRTNQGHGARTGRRNGFARYFVGFDGEGTNRCPKCGKPDTEYTKCSHDGCNGDLVVEFKEHDCSHNGYIPWCTECSGPCVNSTHPAYRPTPNCPLNPKHGKAVIIRAGNGKFKGYACPDIKCHAPVQVWGECTSDNCNGFSLTYRCVLCDKLSGRMTTCKTTGCGTTLDEYEHIYGMLSIGNVTLTRAGIRLPARTDKKGIIHKETLIKTPRSNPSYGDQLTWEDTFPFLYSEWNRIKREEIQSDVPVEFVGFFLGYDFAQIAKSFPADVAAYLFKEDLVKERDTRKPHPGASRYGVVLGDWEIDFYTLRKFTIRKHTHRRARNDPNRCMGLKCKARFLDTADGSVMTISDAYAEIPLDEIIGDGKDYPIEEFDPYIDISLYGLGWPYTNRYTAEDTDSTGGDRINLCDMGSYFQTAFMNVINGWQDQKLSDADYASLDPRDASHVIEKQDGKYLCLTTADELKLIAQGKKRRAIAVFDREMATYNTLENDVLARIARILNTSFAKMPEHINDALKARGYKRETTIGPLKVGSGEWFGPGVPAQQWMLNCGTMPKTVIPGTLTRVDPKTGVTVTEGVEIPVTSSTSRRWYEYIIPPYALKAGQAAYFGGWFEQFMHGHVPGITYEYDINSAYPTIIATLPCLNEGCGEWIETTDVEQMDTMVNEDAAKYRVMYVTGTFKGSDPYIGALPYRNKTGNISRRHIVHGTYLLGEINASIKAGLIDAYKPTRIVAYQQTCMHDAPFASVEDMYLMRLEAGKNSPAGIVAKLVYNSAYGKTAQSIGTPKVSNPIYASMITSGCREMILDAIASHPDRSKGVVMVATDAVYFRKPHPTLVLSETDLGLWDLTLKHNLTMFMPGIYWDDSTRQNLFYTKSGKLKSRGINGGDLLKEIFSIDKKFNHLDSGEWPEATIKIDFAIESPTSAAHRNKWSQCGKVTHTGIRSISSNPRSKRNVDSLYQDGDVWRTNLLSPDINVKRDMETGLIYCMSCSKEMDETESKKAIHYWESIPYSAAFGMELTELRTTQHEFLSAEYADWQQEIHNMLESK